MKDSNKKNANVSLKSNSVHPQKKRNNRLYKRHPVVLFYSRSAPQNCRYYARIPNLHCEVAILPWIANLTCHMSGTHLVSNGTLLEHFRALFLDLGRGNCEMSQLASSEARETPYEKACNAHCKRNPKCKAPPCAAGTSVH